MKPGARVQSPAETVVLIKINKMQNIPRHQMGLRGVESDDERDGNVLLIELVGGLDRRVCAERMTDENHSIPLAVRISISDLPNYRSPAVCAVNPRAIASVVKPACERIHTARKNVGKSTE